MLVRVDTSAPVVEQVQDPVMGSTWMGKFWATMTQLTLCTLLLSVMFAERSRGVLQECQGNRGRASSGAAPGRGPVQGRGSERTETLSGWNIYRSNSLPAVSSVVKANGRQDEQSGDGAACSCRSDKETVAALAAAPPLDGAVFEDAHAMRAWAPFASDLASCGIPKKTLTASLIKKLNEAGFETLLDVRPPSSACVRRSQ